MEPLRRLPPYGGYKGREGVIRRLADMQGRFFFARFSDVERSGLTWIPDFLQRVHAASAHGGFKLRTTSPFPSPGRGVVGTNIHGTEGCTETNSEN